MNIIIWLFRIIPALILFQTLFFKFSGAPESVFIFEQVGMEPLGRYGSGVFELIAAILLILPKYSWLGASMSLVVLSGALFFHLTSLGIDVQNDGGQLFIYAVIGWITSLLTLLFHKSHLPFFKKKN